MDEIGQKLRDARLEKGYTIDDLQQITKIQKRYLIAIEEGNFDALPGDFYVRAFIKQYANVVGINAEKLMDDYQQDIPTVQPKVVEPEEEQQQPTRVAHREKQPKATGSRNKSWRRYWPQIAIGIAAIVIFAIVYGFTIAQQHKESKPSIPVDQSSVSVEGEKSSSKKSSAKSSSSTAESKKTTKKKTKKSSSKVAISAAAGTSSAQTFTVKNLASANNKITVSTTTAAAWMSVTIDGTQSWQGTLEAGASHDVAIPDGATSVVVKSGNAKVNEIAINGTKADLSSSTTVVRTMTFTIEQ